MLRISHKLPKEVVYMY